MIVCLSLCFSRSAHALEAPVISPPEGKVPAPTLISIAHPNPAGSIFYTTDGTDPRDAHGRVRRNARVHPHSLDPESFGGPLSINRPMTVHARVKSGNVWSELAVVNYTVDQDFSRFLITEIMYHPTALKGTPRNEEFIEFKNLGDSPLDLSGLRLVDFTAKKKDAPAIYTFPEGRIAPPGGYVLLIANPESFHSLYPGVAYDGVMPPGPLKLSVFNNQLGRIALIGTDGSVATRMRYQTHAPWPVLPDNHGYFRHLSSPVGFSLTRTTLDPTANPEHFGTWRASSTRLGSPGSDDPDPNIPPLVINEIRTRPGDFDVDAVEIYNPTPYEVPIGGWWLSDGRNNPYKFKFPPEMKVPAKGYLVVDEHDFAKAGSNLSFSSKSERCYLFSGDPEGNLTGYSNGVRFFGIDQDASFGRVESSDKNDYFMIEEFPTFGSANSGPGQPNLMITEIMLYPGPDGFPYIELQNITREPIQLRDPDHPENGWILAGVDPLEKNFPFPENITVPPGGFVMCVPKKTGSIDIPGKVQILRFSKKLFSGTPGTISLYRPAGMSGLTTRYAIVDQANSQNFSPWDPGAAGGGQGLERIGRNAFGNDPASWCAGPSGGTPGTTWQGACPKHPVPEVLVSRTQGITKLLFRTEPGYRYSLEESFDLDVWTTSSAGPILGDGTHSSFNLSPDVTHTPQYFRLAVDVYPSL